jgi:predicted amidohydrolase YtcJ
MCLPLAASEPDLILKDGRIWTGDPAQPWADAVAIRRNRIVAVGDNLHVAATAGPNTHVIDLHGRLTIPGFDDSHTHLIHGALRSLHVDLTGACSVAEMQKRIRDFAAAHPKDPWVVGGGWAYSCFPNRAMPARGDLDSVVKDRPAYLTADDNHTAWVNTKALQLAGITKLTKYAVPTGRVVTDASGEPSGALTGSAMALVRRLVPEIPRDRKLAALEEAVHMLSSLGVTSIENTGGDEETVALLEELDRQHKLNLRVAVYLTVNPGSTPDAIDKILELRQASRDPMVRIAGVDMSLDGQMEAHTAALLEPYANEAGVSGKAMWSQEAFDEMATLCDSGGLQISIHGVGDRAVRMALDGFEAVRRADEAHDSRFRIEQAELVAPADIARFARLGVIAAMIPAHADPGVVDGWSKAVGPERVKLAFPWHTLEQAGARVVFGSDWPSTISADPLRGIYIAVTRQSTDGSPRDGWVGSQRVGVEDALRAWTVNGAYASFDNRARGKLRFGMDADLVVLSQDLFEIAPSDIWKTHVDMTVFDGQVVYTRQ